MTANEGQSASPPRQRWEMSETVEDYLNNIYKDNILSKIKLNGSSIGSGKPLLSTENFFPFSEDSRMTEEEQNKKKKTSRGYTRSGSDKIFLNYLEGIGFPNTQSDYDAYNAKHLTDAEKRGLAALSEEGRNRVNIKLNNIWDNRKIAEDKDVGRTAVHETIHNLTNIHYPNSITEMLRGTSALGQGGDTTNYFHPTERITTKYIDPDTGEFETRPARYWETKDGPVNSKHEQDEMLTQALTNALTGQKPSKYVGGDPSGINSRPWMLYQNMDRPGQGPLGQKGMEEFLMKRIQPFMNQLKSDSEAGYIQNSIWK